MKTAIPHADTESVDLTEKQLIDREAAYHEAIGDVPTLNEAIAAAERGDPPEDRRAVVAAREPFDTIAYVTLSRTRDMFYEERVERGTCILATVAAVDGFNVTTDDVLAAHEAGDPPTVNVQAERNAKKPLTVVPGAFVGLGDDMFVLPYATFSAERARRGGGA